MGIYVKEFLGNDKRIEGRGLNYMEYGDYAIW